MNHNLDQYVVCLDRHSFPALRALVDGLRTAAARISPA